jgi:PncC family amidohydrolase
LTDRGLLLVTAESLTGGLIGAEMTSIPGSSAAYWGGIVSYSVGAKRSLLGVASETIERHGVVSRETAVAMAEGALAAASRESSSVRISIAVTGVAGPGGGTDETPVGTVWMASALCDSSGTVSVVAECMRARGRRDRVRRLTVKNAIRLALVQLDRL